MTFIQPPYWRQLVWFSPILLAMAYDFRSRRLIHPVYLVGLGAFLVRAFSPPLVVGTDTWIAITRWLTGLAA